MPREFLEAYGLGKGALMEVRATGMGLLLRPLRIAPNPGAAQWTLGPSPAALAGGPEEIDEED